MENANNHSHSRRTDDTAGLCLRNPDWTTTKGPVIPLSRPRGELHVQLLFPPGTELDAMGAGLVPGWVVDRGGDERINLDN